KRNFICVLCPQWISDEGLTDNLNLRPIHPLCRLYAIFAGCIGLALVIYISKFGLRIESTKLRFRGYRSEQSGVYTEQRIDDRFKIITARNARPVINIWRVG